MFSRSSNLKMPLIVTKKCDGRWPGGTEKRGGGVVHEQHPPWYGKSSAVPYLLELGPEV
jgi:hypothetical protein